MIAGKEMKMAKVELIINGGDDEFITSEYADKTWDEFLTFNLIEELIGKRKVVQRKLDAARKRMKRLTARLNVIEKGWGWGGLPA